MENIKFVEISNYPLNGTTTFAIIDRGNGEFTSMPKSTYDEMQASSRPDHTDIGGRS